MAKMKTEFGLWYSTGNNDKRAVGKIAIIGEDKKGEEPYVRVAPFEQTICSWMKPKDLEEFAVNILKAIGSKKLK